MPRDLFELVLEPRPTITKVLDFDWTLFLEKTFGKNEDQLHLWQAPRKKAIRTFVAIAGDRDIANIACDDMLDFRPPWLDRIEPGDVIASLANKDLIHFGDVLKTVNTTKRLRLTLPLAELSFK